MSRQDRRAAGPARTVATVALAALAGLAATGCGAADPSARDRGTGSGGTAVPATFCGTVVALNASGLHTPLAVDQNSSEEEIRRLSATVREAADRHIALLDQLERTAPADLRADVALVADLGREFARTMVTLDVTGVTARLLSDVDRAQRTFRAYRVVRAATKERCGVALDLEDELPAAPAEPRGARAPRLPPPSRRVPPVPPRPQATPPTWPQPPPPPPPFVPTPPG